EHTVEKETLYHELWADRFVEDSNLTQHIYILRKTLGKNPTGESYIETVARIGYRLKAAVIARHAASIVHMPERSSANGLTNLGPYEGKWPPMQLTIAPSDPKSAEEDAGASPDAATAAIPWVGYKRLHLTVTGVGALIVAIGSVLAFFLWNGSSAGDP